MNVLAAITLLAAQQIYGPFQPAPRDRAPAVAAAPHGIVLAWSEIEPGARVASIHTALFDHEAQRIGPVHKLASTRANVHATSPTIATDGENFLVAWIERDRHSLEAREIAGVLTDRTGAPLRGTESFGPAVPGAPSVAWLGLEYRLFGAASYSISPAGDARIVNFGVAAQRVPFATPDANGWIEWANEPSRPQCPFLLCGGILPMPGWNLDYAVVTRDWIRSGRVRRNGYMLSLPPVVDASENDLLAVWISNQGLEAQRIVDGEPQPQLSYPDRRARDAVALSMAGSLVVFESGFDLYGVVVTASGFGTIFPISTGEAFDQQPRVTRVGAHRYLVTWLRDSAAIQAQFVDTPL